MIRYNILRVMHASAHVHVIVNRNMYNLQSLYQRVIHEVTIKVYTRDVFLERWHSRLAAVHTISTLAIRLRGETRLSERRCRHAFRTEFQYDATQRRDISARPLQWRATSSLVIVANSESKKIAGPGRENRGRILQTCERGACNLY